MKGAGKFNKRVDILQKREDSLNEYGHATDNWVVQFSRWAAIETGGGREFGMQDQQQADVSHKVTLRSDSATRQITPKHRIRLKDRTLELTKAVDVNEGLMEVSCDCKEVVACRTI